MSSELLKPMAGGPQPDRPIHPGARIGHVHLKVADLNRALTFYCGVLGFELMQRYGTQAAFIAAGGYHHHIGLNTWESLGAATKVPSAMWELTRDRRGARIVRAGEGTSKVLPLCKSRPRGTSPSSIPPP
jgi:hypothetical protein